MPTETLTGASRRNTIDDATHGEWVAASHNMKMEISKEWCENSAKIEGDAAVGAGLPSALGLPKFATPRVDNELRLFAEQRTEPAAQINYLTKLARRLEEELADEKNLHGQAQAAAYEQNQIANRLSAALNQIAGTARGALSSPNVLDQPAAGLAQPKQIT